MTASFVQNSAAFMSDPTSMQILGEDFHAKAFSALLSRTPVDPQVQQVMAQIPSQTTGREHTLLFHFFSTLWSGKRDVLEVGPFIGGSTRAMGLGMLYNPNRDPNCKLHTFDRFGKYGTRDYFLSFLKNYFDSGMLPESLRQQILSSPEQPDFYDIFLAAHQNQPYFPLLSVNKAVLPQSRAELSTIDNMLMLDPALDIEVAFVDACKSWFSTKYMMLELSKLLKAGDYFISQDHGWYTCFWLPSFVETFKEYFSLKAFVDTSYMYQCVQPLTPQMIESRFPDTPEGFSKQQYDVMFTQLREETAVRGDMFGLVHHTLQHAAGLAYIGEKDAARDIIAELSRQPFSKPLRDHVERAMTSPTYREDGTQVTL